MPFRKLEINGQCVDSLSVIVHSFCFIVSISQFPLLLKKDFTCFASSASFIFWQNEEVPLRQPQISAKLKYTKTNFSQREDIETSETQCFSCVYTLCMVLLICVNVLMKDAALSVNSHYIFYYIILLVFCWLLIAQQIILFTPWPLALSTNHSAKCSSANISIGCRLTRRRIQMQHSS